MRHIFKTFIDKEGLNSFAESSHGIFKILMDSGVVTRNFAVAILHVFLVGIPLRLLEMKRSDLEKISSLIQKECYFKKSVSDQISEIFLALLSQENTRFWNDNKLIRFNEFLKQKIEVVWDGNAQRFSQTRNVIFLPAIFT